MRFGFAQETLTRSVEASVHDFHRIGHDVSEAALRNEADVYLFPQTWGDTSLGFGGGAGQAICSAYTVVVIHDDHALVYVCGGLAYALNVGGVIDDGFRNFREDLSSQEMAAVTEARRRYGDRVLFLSQR